MRLEHFARLTRAGVKAGGAAVEGDGDAAAAHAVGGALPAAADLLFGRGAGTLVKVGAAIAGGIYRASQQQAIDVDGRAQPAGQCTRCRPYYRAAGEQRLVQFMDELPAGLIFVLGRRGEGKTAVSMRIAERRARETYVLGVGQHHLPDDWHSLDEKLRSKDGLGQLEKTLPMGSTLLVDDAGLLLDSQEYASGLNKAFKYLIMVCRHREALLIVNVQYASSVTKYVLDTDVFLIKRPPRMWEAIEREELHDLYRKIEPFWARLGEAGRKNHVWALSDTYEGPAHVNLPSFWSDAVSRNKADQPRATTPDVAPEQTLAA